jgi:hypothetical protein
VVLQCEQSRQYPICCECNAQFLHTAIKERQAVITGMMRRIIIVILVVFAVDDNVDTTASVIIIAMEFAPDWL